MEVFKLSTGETVDHIAHTKAVIEKNSLLSDNVRVYVGCDSQNLRRYTSYVVVIAYRYGARGTHYIYKRVNVEKIKGTWDRLSKEVVYSMNLANELRENGVDVYGVDFDFNSEVLARSNELVQWAKGWADSLGYNSSVKPEEQVASRAADHIVKKGDQGARRRKVYRRKIKTPL